MGEYFIPSSTVVQDPGSAELLPVDVGCADATGLYSHAVLKKREFVVLVSLQHALVLAAITPLVLACRGAAV